MLHTLGEIEFNSSLQKCAINESNLSSSFLPPPCEEFKEQSGTLQHASCVFISINISTKIDPLAVALLAYCLTLPLLIRF